MKAVIILLAVLGSAFSQYGAPLGRRAYSAHRGAYPYDAPYSAPYAAPYAAAPYAVPYAAAPYTHYAASSYAAPGAYPYSAPYRHRAYAATPAYVAPFAAHRAAYAPHPTQHIAILRQAQDVNFDGSFNYDFQSEDGIAVQSSGFLKNAGSEAESQVASGSYSYTAPDGTPITTNWFADENGFHAEGAHLPVSPISRSAPAPVHAAASVPAAAPVAAVSAPILA